MVRSLRIPAVCLVSAYSVSVFAKEDPARGGQLYQSRCGACHSVDDNGAGPRHRGVFGRKAATQPGFDYSDALKRSGIIWTAVELNRWLTNPNARVPGNKMVVQLANDPRDRADLIAYLRSVSE